MVWKSCPQHPVGAFLLLALSAPLTYLAYAPRLCCHFCWRVTHANPICLLALRWWVGGKTKLAYLLKRYYNTIDEFRYNEHVPLTETRLADLWWRYYNDDSWVEKAIVSPKLFVSVLFFFFFFFFWIDIILCSLLWVIILFKRSSQWLLSPII